MFLFLRSVAAVTILLAAVVGAASEPLRLAPGDWEPVELDGVRLLRIHKTIPDVPDGPTSVTIAFTPLIDGVPDGDLGAYCLSVLPVIGGEPSLAVDAVSHHWTRGETRLKVDGSGAATHVGPDLVVDLILGDLSTRSTISGFAIAPDKGDGGVTILSLPDVGTGVIPGPSRPSGDVESGPVLMQLTPNPAREMAQVRFANTMVNDTECLLSVYDLRGRLIHVRTLDPSKQGADIPLITDHALANRIASGVYICVLHGINTGITHRTKLTVAK